jgi:DNA repair protein RadC
LGPLETEMPLEVAEFILADNHGDLIQLSRRSLEYLISKYGLTRKKASALRASLEFSWRYALHKRREQRPTSSSEKAYRILATEIGNLPHEECWIALFSKSNKFMKKVKISTGGISSTLVDPKIVFAHVIENRASGVIIYHNHPSGKLNPSREDVELTDLLKSGAETLAIKFLDHIIIAGDSYYSFAEDNNL